MLKTILISFIICFLLERIFSGWRLPKIPTWWPRVIALNLAQLLIVLAAGLAWEVWLSSFSIFDLSSKMGNWQAGFLAYFIATFFFYWWHRARHESDFLWTRFHQIHHSPQRLEVITSFYKHPIEMFANSVFGSVLVYSVLGLNLEAGAIYTMATALGEFFYHTNVRTPRWIGYLFQRPEMHRIHHQHGRHKNNYGDFAIWDMVFGTFENPQTWVGKCGFDAEKELLLGEMLAFKDVHKALVAMLVFFSSIAVQASDHQFSSWSSACSTVKSVVKEGDLIFTDIPVLPFRNVARSTQSWTSHVGVVFLNEKGDWMVAESKVPISKVTPLCTFLKSSAKFRFEIRRLNRDLEESELQQMRTISNANLGKAYTFGFDLNSKSLFCSKFVYKIYQSVGIEVGEPETFKQLLDKNSKQSTLFWRVWFLGNIPWERTTITPASQLQDSQFHTVRVPGEGS